LVLGKRPGAQRRRVVVRQFDDQLVKIPRLGKLAFETLVDDVGENLFDQHDGGVVDVLAFDDLLTPSVDDLALLVHDLVVLQGVLADLGVLTLDRVLGPLDGLGDHLGFDGRSSGIVRSITHETAPVAKSRNKSSCKDR